MPKTTLNTIIKECVSSGHVVLLTQRKSKEKLIALTDSGQIFADEITPKNEGSCTALYGKNQEGVFDRFYFGF